MTADDAAQRRVHNPVAEDEPRSNGVPLPQRGSGRTAVVTLCSVERTDHVRHQLRSVRATAAPADPVHVVLVWIGDEGSLDVASGLGADEVLSVPPGTRGLRLAAARNAGADAAVAAGASLVVFLDADCVAGPRLLNSYRRAAVARPDAVLCGPVTYLPPGVDVDDTAVLDAATAPHAARPAPPDGELVVAGPGDYPLFWSLSFALTADTWRRGPRFDDRYEGYGGEDTDYAFALRDAAVPLVWVGGADAYHQHHATSSPPWQHLHDIVRNGGLFAERWGVWPMEGWLEAFELAGAVRRDADGWSLA
ncbi:glycosyltransferase family 2 protein [Frigoribacterium sp. 2-23]|uniref:glycosyltransferase family 2 protein n=1 Tax=Frigoribacterium sp. 2-23 TaxID=3415006 RepID=UPI003C6EB109